MLVALVAFMGVPVGLGEVLSGLATGSTYGALFFLAGVGSTASWGAWRCLRTSKRPALRDSDDIDLVLALAASEGGRVTLTEVAAKTTLNLLEARDALRELTSKNMATSIVTDDGVEVFHIKGLLGPGEKLAARDILDD